MDLRAVWPGEGPLPTLLRALAGLLLEDPDHRLCAAHAEALLRLRLPPGASGDAPLRHALAHAAPFVLLQPAAAPGDPGVAVVRLDAAALSAAARAARPAAPEPAAAGGAAAAAASAASPGGASVGGDETEEERLAAAVAAAWPDAEHDDLDYLARAIAGALLAHEDAKGQLPRHTLHLTDVGSHLRSLAACDARLASIFPRNRDAATAGAAGAAAGSGGTGSGAGSASGRRVSSGSGGGGSSGGSGSGGGSSGGSGSSGGAARDPKAKPRLSEFVSQGRCVPFFRVIESQVRKGEKALVLLTGALLDHLAAERQRAAAAAAASSAGVTAPVADSPMASDDAPLWAPFGSAVGSGVWGAGPIGADCHPLAATGTPTSRLQHAPGSSGRISSSGAGLLGSMQQHHQQQHQHQQHSGGTGPYRGSIFGGPVDPAVDCGPAAVSAGLGARVELDPLTPGAAGGGRWGSGVPIGIPGSAPGATPLPALQPLVGSFSMGTGLGLGTLLRAFGTDADGAGLLEGADPGAPGSFGARRGDGSLFGPSPHHAPFGAPGPSPAARGALADDGAPQLLFGPGPSSLLGGGSLGLGAPQLDVVPRAIASVWGAPGPAEAAGASPPVGPQQGPASEQPSEKPVQQQTQAAQPPPQQQPQARPSQPQVPTQQPPQPEPQTKRGLRGEAPGSAVSHSSSSSGLASLKGPGAALAAAAESSVPDTEDSTSPLSAASAPAAGAPQSSLEPARPAGAAAAAATVGASVVAPPATSVGLEQAAAGSAGRGGDGGGGGSTCEDPGGDGASSSGVAAGAAEAVGAAEGEGEGDDGDFGGEERDDGGDDVGLAPGADGGVGPAGPKKLTGWAQVAAKTPPKPQRGSAGQQASAPRSAPAPKEQHAAASTSAGGAAAGMGPGAAGRRSLDAASRNPLTRLHPNVREEVERLIARLGGVVRAEDFDEGVAHQLNAKRTWEEAADAVRHLASYDLASIQHPAAYINHVIKHYNPASGGVAGGGVQGTPVGQIRLASVPISTKAMLHKCGLRVYRRVEEAVATTSHLHWSHFDAGVVKVLAELARLSEEDVFEELEALKRSDLKGLQHVPAYLNKRLNNRLWLRRKARDD